MTGILSFLFSFSMSTAAFIKLLCNCVLACSVVDLPSILVHNLTATTSGLVLESPVICLFCLAFEPLAPQYKKSCAIKVAN